MSFSSKRVLQWLMLVLFVPFTIFQECQAMQSFLGKSSHQAKLRTLGSSVQRVDSRANVPRVRACSIDGQAAMDLPDGWYIIAASSQVKENQIVALQRFNESMVLWRKNGVLSAFEDRCPHRHAQLSKGQVVGDRLQCRYHGIEFEKSGRAAMVPETGRGTNALCARTYVVDERQGWIRVKRDSGREAIGERGDFEIADVSEEAAAVEFTTLVRRRWKTHLTRAVESQLDYAHLATLHPILGQFAPESSVHPTIESSEDRMHWYFTDPRYYAEFQYPNLWTLVMPGNLVLSIAFAPVDDSTTDLIAQSGSNTLGNNLIVNLLSESWISQVLSEDQELVETQRPLDSRQDDSEKHFLSDSIIDWYRRRIARE